ncbi:MAG TPA: alcohol dehydrogenase catalytic domain-containing protein [Acidobacteriota bacterium]|nr:alcohol dehydrogenase catalytic domain-containing protein [Acidobacteriota bacterium]
MPQTMLAAVFAGEGSLELQQRPVPSLQSDDQVLIEVEGCGVCGTDLHILSTPPGHPATPGVILGHEYLGRVISAGSEVSQIKVGDRVAVAPNLTCGKCRYCKAGLSNHCSDFTTLGIFLDGGMAPYNLAPERACHVLSDDLPFEEAVWTELLSCVVNSIDLIRPAPGEKAVVIGGGPVGALHAMLLRAAGVRVIVSDLVEERLESLREIGFETVNAGRDDLAQSVAGAFDWGADVVVDAVGNQLAASIELARVGGRICLFGMSETARPAVPQNAITRNELTVLGCYVGTHSFPRAIAILESGIIKPSQLISQEVGVPGLPETIDSLRQGRLMKAVVRH